MKSCALLFSFILALLASPASVSAEPAAGDSLSPEAAALLQQHAQKVMTQRPLLATALGLTDADLGVRVDDGMDDYSSGQLKSWRRTLRQMRRELNDLNSEQIDPVTAAAMDNIYTDYLGDSKNPFGYIDASGRHRPYVINQISHPLQQVPDIIANFQLAQTPEQAGDYLRRLWAMSPMVDSVLGKFNSDADAGWIPPRSLLEGGLDFLDGFTAPTPREHPLYTALMEQVNASGAFTPEQREQVGNEAATIIATVIYPAYRNAVKTVNDRLTQARKEAGIWAQPLGDQFYRTAIRTEAGSDKSAAVIHALGLAEVERIHQEMDVLLQSLGYREGSVGQRWQQLSAESRVQYPVSTAAVSTAADSTAADSTAAREQLLAAIDERIAAMQAQLPNWFGRLPSQGLEVRQVTERNQDTAPMGRYDGPSADGQRPGIFWINLRDMGEVTRLTVPTLVYHETVPGHHLGTALAYEQVDKPLLWRFGLNTVYSEGWGLYSELLAAEMGVYESDPLGDLGRLQDELFRAARLVVDTGLHSERWSRQQAIEYLQQVTGRDLARITSEVERYMAWPGQALSYKLGMLELLEIREQARAALGDAFDIRSFHDLVLSNGAVPMSVVREQVQAWAQPD